MLNVICASSMRGILWDTMAWERSAAAVAQEEATRSFHSEGERISISFIQKLIVQKCTSVLVFKSKVIFCSAELSSFELCHRLFCRVGVCILRMCGSSRNECLFSGS